MKNILLIVPLFLIIGCGVFDKKDINDAKLLEDNERVDYTDTNGSYDLAEYLFPNKNQTNIYEVNGTNSSFDNVKLSDYTQSKHDYYVLIDNNRINLGDNIYYLTDKNLITRIERSNGFENIERYRRYLDKGDVYYSYERIDGKDSYTEFGELSCRLIEHNSTMSIFNHKYNDILHLGCFGDFLESTKNSFSKYKKYYIDSFYAKDIGLIKQIYNKKEENQYGNTDFNFYVYRVTNIKEIQQ